MELKDTAFEKAIRDFKARILFSAASKPFTMEVLTAAAAKDAADDTLRRTYRLNMVGSRGVQVEHWGARDLDGLYAIFSRLLQYTDFEIDSITAGWTARCGACGHVTKGEHYETHPTNCRNKSCSLKAAQFQESVTFEDSVWSPSD